MKSLNNYDSKQASNKEYYAQKSQELRAEADRLYEYDRKLMSLIPFGQPILVGHHSEKRHRNDLKRSQARRDKARAFLEKSEYYERRANLTNHAISSDDEDAITKLKAKIACLEQQQIEMKRINSEYRKGSSLDAVTGLTEEMKKGFKRFFAVCPYERVPYPAYSLTNNGAEIRRTKQRIAELESRQKTAAQEEIIGKGYTIKENKEDNRIWFIFDEKPSREICQIMRHSGFKWSPNRGTWIRMLNSQGRYMAKDIIEKLNSF